MSRQQQSYQRTVLNEYSTATGALESISSQVARQPPIICSKLTLETLEQGLKYAKC